MTKKWTVTTESMRNLMKNVPGPHDEAIYGSMVRDFIDWVERVLPDDSQVEPVQRSASKYREFTEWAVKLAGYASMPVDVSPDQLNLTPLDQAIDRTRDMILEWREKSADEPSAPPDEFHVWECERCKEWTPIEAVICLGCGRDRSLQNRT